MNTSTNADLPGDISATAQTLKANGNQFAVATVVRTVAATAAKPGAKAIINASGEVVDGWIGGGCARHAVTKAAIKSINDGEPRLVSIAPEDLLEEQGLTAGVEQNGVIAANNMCPSQGSMEIFVEPVLSDPQLLIMGTSPVAIMLAQLAQPFAFTVVQASHSTVENTASERPFLTYENLPATHEQRYIVVATQGSGDLKALQAAMALQARQISFVGSHKKTQHLKDKLVSMGETDNHVDAIKGPAGLDIGGVTPQEIALSILAEIISIRRRKSETLLQS